MKKTIFYLRTDIYNKPLIAGGSVTHTLGVIEGFLECNYNVICASSLELEGFKQIPFTHFISLKNPRFLKFLRWKLNCLLSNIFFTISCLKLFKKKFNRFCISKV